VAFCIGTLSDKIFALFWPPNVVLFCALLLVPNRNWWQYIAAAFPAHLIAELGVGMPASQLLVAFATNCMVALLNAYGVLRCLGAPPWFGTFRKASIYIAIVAGIGPAVSAFGGAFVPILGGGPESDYWTFWSHWYFANALPNLTLGPFFLIWVSDDAGLMRWRPSRRQIEPVALAAVLVCICIIATIVAGRLATDSLLPAVLFLPLPLVLFATVRFRAKGASGAILIVAVVLTWGTLQGHGLFVGEDPERSVLALQLFMTGLSIPLLLLGALIGELRGAERMTRELAASLIRAQDQERRRIGRDLHDSTGQNLIAATLIVSRLENTLPPSAGPAMRQLEDMLQQSIREVRSFSYLLHPPLLDEAGLELALRCYVEGYIERSGIAVDLDLSRDEVRLPPETELVLFRVVQEALANISRHSKSPTARIRLLHTGHDTVLTIEDDGLGMPVGGGAQPWLGPNNKSPITCGVGLASMSERLGQIGGRLEIDSVPGRTTLTAVIPVREEGT
jgi:signal transduction histidine kinase